MADPAAARQALAGYDVALSAVPYYFNLAPNYDATLTPRLLTTRGLQIATEFRYLTERNEGALQFEYLPNDDQFGDTRRTEIIYVDLATAMRSPGSAADLTLRPRDELVILKKAMEAHFGLAIGDAAVRAARPSAQVFHMRAASVEC